MPITLTPEDGRGATLALGTSTWESNILIISITPEAIQREALPTSHLGTTTAKTFILEDLYDPGGFTIEFYHTDVKSPDMITTTTVTGETGTITYPMSTGAVSAATIAGTVLCTEFTPGQLQVGELSKGSAKFKFTGALTFTSAT